MMSFKKMKEGLGIHAWSTEDMDNVCFGLYKSKCLNTQSEVQEQGAARWVWN